MTVHSIRNFGIGRGQIFIGGRWVDAVSRDRREIRNPKDETSVDEVASSGVDDAD
jgi:lactaldehyde dehydrogenase/glycolaldehyde dehydrogenase